MLKKILLGLLLMIVVMLLFLQFYIPDLPAGYGKVETELFVGETDQQPLIVGFGGGEGGNAWASDYWKSTRDRFIDEGYAFLAIGYFGRDNTSGVLDRISLNAIYDSIMKVAQHPKIDQRKIALIGGSKGAELILNLASRYPEFTSVVAIVPSHVSFPATTILSATSSWNYNDEQIPFVPMTWAATPAAMKQDLHKAFSIMLEDDEAVKNAEIPVEKVNGSILFLSATEDELCPSMQMSEKMMERLEQQKFTHFYQHIAIEGGHTEPLKHFDTVFNFLSSHFKDNSSRKK